MVSSRLILPGREEGEEEDEVEMLMRLEMSSWTTVVDEALFFELLFDDAIFVFFAGLLASDYCPLF